MSLVSEDLEKPLNFIQQLVAHDLQSGKYEELVTRFPPEPNGYLHIGHAKSICLNFGLIKRFGGRCNLRFDDTNPLKEEEEFVQAIREDVEWLGYQWSALTYSSDYYQQLYDYALMLIEKDLAYVDSLSMEQIREHRGSLQEPGKNSPHRDRSIAENLQLFSGMKAGDYPEGTHVLRAKIDMQSPNINLRDPVLYRIRFAKHQRTGDAWCIYPMYDYAHPISDALEQVTHSLCTLEFQDHRPLYDWLIQHLTLPGKPEQTEFSRLNLSHTVTSKRKLRELVDKALVSGWDDPRMPTLKGMRRRGYPAEAIREFCEIIGISRSDSVIDMSILEEAVRSVLNRSAKRMMCVQDPIPLIIDNYPSGQTEDLDIAYDWSNPSSGSRIVPFGQKLYIERSDFMDNPSKDFFRLSPGKEVRLRHAYVICCTQAEYNDAGELIASQATYDPDTLGKNPVGRKVKGVIHWVAAATAHPMALYLYDRLFRDANPAREQDFLQFLNPNSLTIKQGFAEPGLASLPLDEVVQLERLGYYALHQANEQGQISACQRVVDLKDSWGKIDAGLSKP